jgi:uncharacterized protein
VLAAGELAGLAIAVLAAGVTTGILAGLFGIGGGAVIVPVLFEVFRLLGVADEVRMQLCVGTSLAIILPTALRSYRAHHARGLVMPYVLRLWTVPVILGVGVGSIAAAFAPAALFKAAFAVIAGIIAARLLSGRGSWMLGSELPGRTAMTVYGFVVGVSIRRGPQCGHFGSIERLRRSGLALWISMMPVRVSMPKSVKAMTLSSPGP